MSQRSNLFSEHATRYADALASEPTLTLSVYCRRQLVSYTGLRKWMCKHGMKSSNLKRARREVPSPESGSFVMMPAARGDAGMVVQGADVLHDVSMSMPGGVGVSIGTVSAGALALLINKINMSCSL